MKVTCVCRVGGGRGEMSAGKVGREVVVEASKVVEGEGGEKRGEENKEENKEGKDWFCKVARQL